MTVGVRELCLRSTAAGAFVLDGSTADLAVFVAIAALSVVRSSLVVMAQQFEDRGPRGRFSASGVAGMRATASPVIDMASPQAPVPLIDLGGLAQTAGERALAELIEGAYTMPVDERLARPGVDPQLFTVLTRLDLDTADDAALVEAAAAAERVEAAAHAIKLRAAAALSRREAMRPAALAQREGAQRDVAGDELAQGAIDATRAQVIVDGLEHVSAEVAATVESRVLGRAPQRTVAQLRADVAKALIAVDADEAAHRARQRVKERRVSRPRAHPDGIASMRLEGPAADVLSLDVALHTAAQAAKSSGDERSIDQLRFDALAGIAHRALATGRLGADDAGLPLGTQHGHRPTILVTISLDQLLQPADTASGAPGDDGLWPPPLPGEHLPADQVPTLDGYGPISPLAARALAASGDWVRIVTDPLTGAVLDVGHTRYRPTQAMVDHILARDRTCVRPGCTHRASECQLDHTLAWDHTHPDQGGRTAVSNLGALCPRDHQVKTHGDFRLTQSEPGVFEWVTPAGRRYRRERDGTTTSLGHHTHSPRYGAPSSEPPDADPPDCNPPAYGPPPF